MRILALETSCDETAAAIIQDGRQVLSNIISSQAQFHAQYGGVIPEFAARQHLDQVNDVVQMALNQANCLLEDIDAFAATLGPGLVGALLVGANVAKTLSLLTHKPFLGVHHLQAHVASNYLQSTLEPPFICLLVSGGHTQLLHVADYQTMTLMGQTLDDAVGEAYDKVARVLGLPYPGGPLLDKLASEGNALAYTLPRPRTAQPYDFSFSGLKTAVLRLIQATPPEIQQTQTFKADVAASFQHTVVEILRAKTTALCQQLGVYTVCIAGGVAANAGLRTAFLNLPKPDNSYHVVIPDLLFCTDNAAMVGAAAYYYPISTQLSAEVFSRGALPTT